LTFDGTQLLVSYFFLTSKLIRAARRCQILDPRATIAR